MLSFLKKPKLSQEAFEAYFQRLPESIRVVWKKDGDLIVGRVKFEDGEFATQARSPEEFVHMVNEGVLLSYSTPTAYLDLIKKTKTFLPPDDELLTLGGKEGSLTFHREKDLTGRVFA